ncbi:Uncharacterized mitochondrial protein AtMg00310, partial [Linum grandiflorum]
LLTKQLWGLYQRPNALISRILKAKYHKHTSFLDANVGYRPSFIWRTLLSVQDFLWRGLRWCIGNGSDVAIWGDKWVPTVVGHYITSAPQELAVDAKVRELIDSSTEQWDTDLVERCFPTDIAVAITQIPLRDREEPDAHIWESCKNICYSTRAGYWLWLTEYRVNNPIQVRGTPEIWKHLWRLRIPPKVKHFLW